MQLIAGSSGAAGSVAGKEEELLLVVAAAVVGQEDVVEETMTSIPLLKPKTVTTSRGIVQILTDTREKTARTETEVTVMSQDEEKASDDMRGGSSVEQDVAADQREVSQELMVMPVVTMVRSRTATTETERHVKDLSANHEMTETAEKEDKKRLEIVVLDDEDHRLVVGVDVDLEKNRLKESMEKENR